MASSGPPWGAAAAGRLRASRRRLIRRASAAARPPGLRSSGPATLRGAARGRYPGQCGRACPERGPPPQLSARFPRPPAIVQSFRPATLPADYLRPRAARPPKPQSFSSPSIRLRFHAPDDSGPRGVGSAHALQAITHIYKSRRRRPCRHVFIQKAHTAAASGHAQRARSSRGRAASAQSGRRIRPPCRRARLKPGPLSFVRR